MRKWSRRGVTLIELIVVLGIVMILAGLLMPAIASARRLAKSVKCRAQLQQIGQALSIYANQNRGEVFPQQPGRMGSPIPWQTILFGANAKSFVICPTAPDGERQSYEMNFWLWIWQIRSDGNARWGGKAGAPPSEIVVIGENLPMSNAEVSTTSQDDPPKEQIDFFRHGKTLRSNYLWLDMHVSNDPWIKRPGALGLWDVPHLEFGH